MKDNRCRVPRALARAYELAVTDVKVAETAACFFASEAQGTCGYSVLFYRSSNR